MKLQLTRTKTIEISFPGGGRKACHEITGVELFARGTNGCPAVRIQRQKNECRVLAVGEITPPEGALPERWDELTRQTYWELPREFQSVGAALATHSPDALFGQASADAILREMIQGVTREATAEQASSAGPKRFSIRKKEPEKPVEAEKSGPQRNSAPTTTTPARKIELPEPGVPVAENGRRFVVRPFAEKDFHLRASLPEYQTLWLSRLLPEGHRPTARSVQVAEAALMASVLAQPFLKEQKGDALVLFVQPDYIAFAGFKGGQPVLWRHCPGTAGEEAMRRLVIQKLGIEEDLIDSVLNDSLIDPRPVLESFLHPVLEQLELSRAYLAGKYNISTDRVFVMGLSSGISHWQQYAAETIHVQLVAPDPFEGLTLGKGVEVRKPQRYLTALGAALAALEVGP